jgi:hypothetical protein
LYLLFFWGSPKNILFGFDSPRLVRNGVKNEDGLGEANWRSRANSSSKTTFVANYALALVRAEPIVKPQAPDISSHE